MFPTQHLLVCIPGNSSWDVLPTSINMQRDHSSAIYQPNQPLTTGILNNVGSSWFIKLWNGKNDDFQWKIICDEKLKNMCESSIFHIIRVHRKQYFYEIILPGSCNILLKIERRYYVYYKELLKIYFS